MSQKQNVRIVNRFEYHVEDLDCEYCLYKKAYKPCKYKVCPFNDIRDEAVKNGRTKRKKGYFTLDF